MLSNWKCLLDSIEMRLETHQRLRNEDYKLIEHILVLYDKIRDLGQQYPQLHSRLRTNFPDTDFNSPRPNLKGSGDISSNSTFDERASHSGNMVSVDELSSNVCALNLEDSLVCEHCDEEILLLNNDLEFSYQMHKQTQEHVEAMNDFKMFHSSGVNEADANTTAPLREVSLYHWTSPYISTKLLSSRVPFKMVEGKYGNTLYKTNFVFNDEVKSRHSKTQKWRERFSENKQFQNTLVKIEKKSCKGANPTMAEEKNVSNNARKDSSEFQKRRECILENKHSQDTSGEIEGSSRRVNCSTAWEKKRVGLSSNAVRSRLRAQKWKECVQENKTFQDSSTKVEGESSKEVDRTATWVEKVASSNAVKARFGIQNSKERVLEKEHFQDKPTSSAKVEVEEGSSPWDSIGKKMYFGFCKNMSFTNQSRLRKKHTKADLCHY